MTNCDCCIQPATRFARQWFQFPRDPWRVTTLCDGHWNLLLEQLDRLAGPVGRCPRCHTRLTEPVEKCRVCGFCCPISDLVREAA